MNEKPAEAETIKVRAFAPGYIGDGPLGAIYRHIGDVFTLQPRHIPLLNDKGEPQRDAEGAIRTTIMTAKQQFSENWMEVAPEDEPEKLTTAQQEINREIGALNASGSKAE